MRRSRLKLVLSGRADERLRAAAEKLGLPPSTLASLIIEGVAGGYSNKLGFSVRENGSGKSRVFRFRIGSRGYG